MIPQNLNQNCLMVNRGRDLEDPIFYELLRQIQKVEMFKSMNKQPYNLMVIISKLKMLDLINIYPMLKKVKGNWLVLLNNYLLMEVLHIQMKKKIQFLLVWIPPPLRFLSLLVIISVKMKHLGKMLSICPSNILLVGTSFSKTGTMFLIDPLHFQQLLIYHRIIDK